MKRIRIPRGSGSDALPPLLSDIEIARMWRSLNGTPTPLPRRKLVRPPFLVGVGLATLAAAVAFVVVLVVSPRDPPAESSAFLENANDGEHELELPEGSKVLLAAQAKLRFVSSSPEDVELVLLRGAADFSVSKPFSESRRFVIAVGGFDVQVKGARLRVAVSGDYPDRRVEVKVEEGRVEVQRQDPDGRPPVILAAGEAWSSEPSVPPSTLPRAPRNGTN